MDTAESASESIVYVCGRSLYPLLKCRLLCALLPSARRLDALCDTLEAVRHRAWLIRTIPHRGGGGRHESEEGVPVPEEE